MKEQIMNQSFQYKNCTVFVQIRCIGNIEKKPRFKNYLISVRASKGDRYLTLIDNLYCSSILPLQVWSTISNPDTENEKILLRVIKRGDIADYIFHMGFSVKKGETKIFFRYKNRKSIFYL